MVLTANQPGQQIPADEQPKAVQKLSHTSVVQEILERNNISL